MDQLQYHPTRHHILLSGSTDGLVNVYDTRITDENDALSQVINHGSVHRAGFLDDRTIYALSHDEVFSIYPATDPDETTTDDPQPIQFGNLREPLGCEYIAQLCLGDNQNPCAAAGNKAYESAHSFCSLLQLLMIYEVRNIWISFLSFPRRHGDSTRTTFGVSPVRMEKKSSAQYTLTSRCVLYINERCIRI